ncbi:sigma-70 family RNA polymerase sigma factor [Verrucomicrobium sp. BvORR034]|uniref:sigma-70 family RNA polymerase sigma factor n=1 Tax=Verrucomicrobium sp. BvORR034 TaxID=1396418 RepID=UPI000678E280|nr:sigma-70 family RNA polymerase sigma factor [Verrucomicrobium sp. BvORR034]
MGSSYPNSSSSSGDSDRAPVQKEAEVESRTFDENLALHALALKQYVRSLLPGYHGADDVAQEALVKIWEKKHEFTSGTNFKAWIFTIARFYVMNQRRKLARSPVSNLDDELMDQIDRRWMAEEIRQPEEELQALRQCMSSLNAADQQLLHVRYATKTSLETYAQNEGLSSGSLKARLFRLRETLRRCIELRLQA